MIDATQIKIITKNRSEVIEFADTLRN